MIAASSYWPDILTAQAAFVLATISPGPALMATIGTAMSAGRRTALALGLGIVAGSFCWALVTAVGLSAVIAAHSGVLQVIRVLGGCYLLFLAWKAWRAAAAPRELTPQTAAPAAGRLAHFLRGLAIHLTNPKAILAWIAIVSLGIRPGAPPWVPGAIIGGAMLFALCFYTLCAVGFSTPAVLRIYGRARRWIDGLLCGFFVYAAVRLLIVA